MFGDCNLGGIGSGRVCTRPRVSVEESVYLDIGELRTLCGLMPGTRVVTTFSGVDRPSVVFRSVLGDACLSVRVETRPTTDPVDPQHIALARVACHLGGCRAYLVCPGDGCQARCQRLYLRDGQFRCRRCHDLYYASQRQSSWSRALGRANRLREELGGRPGTQQAIAPRPRGMWRSTYLRKRRALMEAEHVAMQWLADRHRLLDRLP